MSGLAIVEATDANRLTAVRELLAEYCQALGGHICSADLQRELDGLPGSYQPPEGGLWLAFADDAVAGCVALRRLDQTTAELKRLFVRPAFRRRGLGRDLARTAMVCARDVGYQELQLDTAPRMTEARALYESLGFRPVINQAPACPECPIILRRTLTGSLPFLAH